MSSSSNRCQESESAKRVKLEIKSEIVQIKQEIHNNILQSNSNSDLIRIKNEKIENLRLKQESLETARVKEELIPTLTRSDTQPISESEQGETETEVSHGLPKQTSKPRPKRPKRNALSLAKIASIDTEDLFMYNSEKSLKSPLKDSLQEVSAYAPIIETEEDRYPSEFGIQVKRKKRQNVDVLLGKYDSGIGVLNEDGSVEESGEFSNEKKVETFPEINEDKELDMFLSRPKTLKNSHGPVRLERTEIDEITEKYDFINQNTKLMNDSVNELEDIQLNRSTSKDFTVRIMCSRSVHSFQVRYDTAFEEIIPKLANKLEVEPQKIMLTLKDDTVGPNETPLSLNLDESSIVDAIILSTAHLSPHAHQTNEPQIKIKLQFSKQLGGLVPIIAPVNTELNGILSQICEFKDLTHIKFQLQFDGEILDLSNTLQDYEIEEGDVIDAIVVT